MPSQSMITLDINSTTACTSLRITEDVLVEGQELFEVYFEVDDYFGSYAVNGSNTTTITILDSNGRKLN